MKKSVLVLIVVAAMLGACSEYTCATYAKKAPEKPVKESKI